MTETTNFTEAPTSGPGNPVVDEPPGATNSSDRPSASGQPLALAGFALSLGLLSLANAEWIDINALGLIVPLAFGYGAVALLLAGMWDFRANNLFGATWAVSFGCFWLTLALLLGFFADDVVSAAGAPAFTDGFAWFLVLWGIFTAYMTVGAYFIARPAFVAFALLALMFFVLAIANFADSSGWRILGGYIGLVDALVAWYLSAALIINTTADRQLLPIWPYPYSASEG